MNEPMSARESRPEMQRVNLSRIHRDKAYQVRVKLDAGNLNRLRRKYEAGVAVEPIMVAKIEGQPNPVLIAGFHRVAAMLALGWNEADAEVITTTAAEAKWLAAQSNLGHGQPLKTRELRQVFRAFIGARKHRITKRGRPEILPYREIGAEIGVNYSTVRRWMIADYPKIAEAMSDDESPLKGKGGLAHEKREVPQEEVAKVLAALNAIPGAFKAIHDPTLRGSLIEAAEALVRELRHMGNWTASDF